MKPTSTDQPVRVLVDSPRGREAFEFPAGPGALVLSRFLRRQGLPLNTRCGERGLCDGCTVELREGALVHAPTGRTVRAAGGPVPLRGCEHHPAAGEALVCLRVPARSLPVHEPVVLSAFKINVPFAHAPLVPAPEATDQETLGLGVAIDVGTTTVALVLVDLSSGQIVGTAAGYNRQMHLGDDVLTRISLCANDPAMLSQLQHAVGHQTIAPLIGQALRSDAVHGHGRGRPVCVGGLVVAGNATMLHLLAGVDPTPMGVAPFTPVFLEHRVVPCGQIALDLSRHASAAGQVVVHLLPGASAYVGADLVAGMIASGLAYDDGPSLLVDVGTNGEVVLKHGQRILACATAAGPAFEGARLTSGIRAGRGAVSDIRFTTDPFAVHVRVIGDEQPIGICGSAYIDFLAEGRRIGLLSSAGRLEPRAAPGAAEHITRHQSQGQALRIARAGHGQDILISDADVAALLQAKAAIAAGILTLLDQAGLKPVDVKTLYLAGGFGTHLDHRYAIACGLLPGFRADQVQVVGNSALAGAYLALVDRSVLEEMSRLAQRVQIVELNLDPRFEERFIDQLALP